MKKEACQSIQQMQMLENNQFDMDDPMDEPHGPVRLPYFRKGTKNCTNFNLKIISNSICFR